MRITAAILAVSFVLPVLPAAAQGPPSPGEISRQKLGALKLTGSWIGQELRPTAPPLPGAQLILREMTVKARLGGALLELRRRHSPPGHPSIDILDILGFDAHRQRFYFERHSSFGHNAVFYGNMVGKRLVVTLPIPGGPEGAGKTCEFEGDGPDHLLLLRHVGEPGRRVCIVRAYMHRKGKTPRWWQKHQGWIDGGKREATRFKTAQEWKAFRETAAELRMPQGVKRIDRVPLPDHDFSKGQLLLLRTASVHHQIRLHEVTPARVVVEELDPEGEAGRASKPNDVSNFVLLQIHQPKDDFEVVWK